MSKRIGVTVAALLSLLAIGVGAARAGVPTGIAADDSGTLSDDPGQTYFVGHLTSPKAKCVADRKVKILYGYNGSPDPRLVDTDHSSKEGAFAGDGPTQHAGNGLVFIRVRVLEKNIGTRHHPNICASFQDDFG